MTQIKLPPTKPGRFTSMIKEIANQAPLNEDEIRRAAARSPKLANMIKTAQETGLEFEVVEVAVQEIEEGE